MYSKGELFTAFYALENIEPGTEIFFDYDGANTLHSKFSWINDNDEPSNQVLPLPSHNENLPPQNSKKSSKTSIIFISPPKVPVVTQNKIKFLKKSDKNENPEQIEKGEKKLEKLKSFNDSRKEKIRAFDDFKTNKIFKKIKINQNFNSQTNIFIIKRDQTLQARAPNYFKEAPSTEIILNDEIKTVDHSQEFKITEPRKGDSQNNNMNLISRDECFRNQMEFYQKLQMARKQQRNMIQQKMFDMIRALHLTDTKRPNPNINLMNGENKDHPTVISIDSD